MAGLKLTNNPCKFCNGEIDEGSRCVATSSI